MNCRKNYIVTTLCRFLYSILCAIPQNTRVAERVMLWLLCKSVCMQKHATLCIFVVNDDDKGDLQRVPLPRAATCTDTSEFMRTLVVYVYTTSLAGAYSREFYELDLKA